jgi:hypothetical protein
MILSAFQTIIVDSLGRNPPESPKNAPTWLKSEHFTDSLDTFVAFHLPSP